MVVRLGVSGDPDLGWLDSRPDATVRRSGLDYHEVQVRPGIDPESILQEALARHEYVTRFEIAEPSIEDIFIETGRRRRPTEERTLAAVGAEPDR